MKQEDCTHDRVFFGSGDYYLFCTTCRARWVMCGAGSDEPRADLANKGVGAQLSGKVRAADPT